MKKISYKTFKLDVPLKTELILQVRISTTIQFTDPKCIKDNEILSFKKINDDVFEVNLGKYQNVQDVKILFTTTFDFRNSDDDEGVINITRIYYKLSTESNWSTIKPLSGLDPAKIPAERLQPYYKYFKF